MENSNKKKKKDTVSQKEMWRFATDANADIIKGTSSKAQLPNTVIKNKSKKWYSGANPTARETVAQMYKVSNGNKAKFQELENKYNAEINNRGSVIYNPYTSATNYKEIEALQAAGIDVSGGITAEWFKENQWLRNHARTNTGYGALAPSSKSSALENAAWAYENLLDAETRTAKAETELATMANEAKYWADLGYSDDAIVKKLKNNSDYGTLWKMDEERQQGGASLLNRAIDYNGDDTMYGMIWAARNGSTGNWFADSVKYTLGQGNKYKSDPYSEAARDPSNYEGYHPYILGSTLHTQNQKHGITSVDQKWLDDNRWMLNDADKKDDYIKYQDAYEFTQKAETELNALNSWLETELEKVGDNEQARDNLVAVLKAKIEDGDEITYRYVDEDGKSHIETIKLTNLSKMEEARKDGGAANIAYALDFTLPRYIDKIDDTYEQNVSAAKKEAENAAAEKGNKENIFQKAGDAIDTGLTTAGEWLRSGWEDNQYNRAADSGGTKGNFGADVQGVFDARVGAETADEVFANYIKNEFGVEFGGTLTDKERAIVEKAISANEAATTRGYSEEGKAEAEESAAAMFALAQAISGQPDRLKTKEDEYINSAAYSTVVGANQQKANEADLYARGMIEGELTPQAHIADAGGSNGAMPEIDYKYRLPNVDFDDYAWTAMLDGSSEWNGDLFEQALAISADPNAIMVELSEGIADQMRGGEGNAISRSWMKKFGGMTRNTTARFTYNKWGDMQQTDSRSVYGPEIGNAILLNEKALNKGAISKEEYIANLINLSSTAEIVQAAAGGKRVKPKLSAEVLASGDGSLGKGIEDFEAYCNEKLAVVEKKEAEEAEIVKNGIIATRDAYVSGTMDESQSMANAIILGNDVSEVSKKDKTYKKFSKYLEAAAPGENSYADLQMQAGDPNSPANTIGGYDAVYNRGVSALAMNVLDRDMHYAAALGMSLDEYYETYPEYSKSPEQLLADAQEEFDAKWEEFGNSPDALQAVSEILGVSPEQLTGEVDAAPEYGEHTPIYEDGLTLFDIFTNATSKFANDTDQNLAKMMHFFQYDLGNENEKLGKLYNKYGTDPAALNDAWEKLLLSDELSDEQKAEIRARLDTTVDIYKMGDPDELMSHLDISEYEQVGKYYDDVIAANGTELEKELYKVMAAGERMIADMALASTGNMYGIGSYATSLMSMAPNEYANAYDYTRITGDANSAFLWSTAALGLTAKIEQWQMDTYLTPKASKWDDAIWKAKYQLSKKGVFKTFFSPDGLMTMLKGVLAVGGKSATNAGGEFTEEFSQSLVDSAAKHRALKDKAILTKEDFKQATIEGMYGGVLGFAAGGFAGDVGVDLNDYVGTEIESAEAILDDAADGNAINEAIEFESTVAAIQESGEQLAQLQDSAEYKAVATTEAAYEAAQQKAAEIAAEYDEVANLEAHHANALAELDEQMKVEELYTEEMAKRTVETTNALAESQKKLEELASKKAEADAEVESARAAHEAAQAQVQQMYRQIIDTAKAKAAQEIADTYYNGNTEEQKAASEEYRNACKELQEANKELAKATFENARGVQRGRALIAVDKLKAKVAEARAKVQEAFQNAPESKEAADRKQELEAAESEVQKAVEEVKQAEAQVAENAAESIENLDEIDADEQQRHNDASDRVLEKKQLALIAAQAKLEAVKAKQNLDSIKSGINTRLNSRDANARAEAVAEWQAAQQEADAAVQEAQEAEALYNETDTQKQLREATENMKQYTNEQLLFEDVEGHVDAVRAYNRLLLAKAEAKAEKALMNANNTKIGTEEHTKAVAEYNQAVEELEDEVGRQMGTDGDVVRNVFFRTDSLATQALDAVKEGNTGAAANAIKSILDFNLPDAKTLASYSTLEAKDGKTFSNAQIAHNIAQQLVDNAEGAAQIMEVLNSIQEQMWADHRSAGKTGQATTVKDNPIEILRKLTKSLHVGYKPGASRGEMGTLQRKAIKGLYDAKSKAIKTKTNAAGDLDIGLHEFGLAVSDKLANLEATEDMRNALSPEVKAVYDEIDLGTIAVAEFVVDYMFSRDGAIAKAGVEFVQKFENMVKQDKRLYKAIKEASDSVVRWNNASTIDKARSMMKDGAASRSKVGSWLSQQLRAFETGMFDVTAPAKLVSKEFHKKALYTQHAIRRADVILTQALVDPNTNEQVGASLAETLLDVNATKENVKDALLLQMLKHHLARLENGKPVFDANEFSKESIEQAISELQSPELEAIGNAITSWWNKFVDVWLVGSGFVSQEVVNNMRDMYKNYLPTFRVMDVDVAAYGGKRSKFQMREAVNGGSSLEIINPLVSIVSQVQKAVTTVTQNQLMQEFHKEYQKDSQALGEIATYITNESTEKANDAKRIAETLKQLRQAGEVSPDMVDDLIEEMGKMSAAFNASPGKNTIAFFDTDGTVHYYKIHDTALFNLLSGNTETMLKGLKAVKAVKNMMTALTTGSNMLFAVKNAIRDFQMSVNTGTWAYTYADGAVKWVKTFVQILQQTDGVKEWRALGGGEHTNLSAALGDKDAAVVQKELTKMLLRGKHTANGNFKISKTAFDAISNVVTAKGFNNIIEETSRLVEYLYGKHDKSTSEGKTEAFMASQDVTTNYGTHGAYAWLQVASAVTPFLNASLQGIHKDAKIIADLFNKDKSVRRAAAPKAAKIAVNSMLTAVAQWAVLALIKRGNRDDEEYAMLESSAKAGNFIIPIPDELFGFMSEKFGFKKPYIRLPIAQGVLHRAMYAASLDTFSDVANYSPFELELWDTVLSVTLESAPSYASVFQGWIDASRNKTWYDSEIENSRMQKYSEYNRYDDDTPGVVTDVSRFAGTSPAKTDYVLQQSTGIAHRLGAPLLSGKGFSGLFNSVMNYYTIDPVVSNNMSSSVYAAKEMLTQTVNEGKDGLPMGNIAYDVDGFEAYKAAENTLDVLNDAIKYGNRYWSLINDLPNDSSLTQSEKVALERQYRTEIYNIYADAMEEFDEFYDTYGKNRRQFGKALKDLLNKNYTRPTAF